MTRHPIVVIPFCLALLVLAGRFATAAPSQPVIASPTPTVTQTTQPIRPSPTARPTEAAQLGHVPLVHQSEVLPTPTPFPTRTLVPTRGVPPIRAVQPKDHGFLSPLDPIQITFGREVDRASVEAAFNLTPAVTGSFEWQKSTLIFRPASRLFAEGTPYTFSLATTARTATGEPLLTEPLHSMFHTTQLENDLAWFGDGADVQTLNADGRRAVQLATRLEAAHTIAFELYALSPERFIELYTPLIHQPRDEPRRTLSTNGATLVRRWALPEDAPSLPMEGLSVRETLIPADAPPGLYLLNLKVGRLNDQLFIVLTRHTLTLRRASGQLTAWVTDSGGTPSLGVEVTAIGKEGQLLAGGVTDVNGLTTLAVPEAAALVLARSGDSVTATGLSGAWRTSNHYGGGQPEAYAGYIITDRKVYRPGETVNVKAFLRREAEASLEMLPEGTPVTVSLLRWQAPNWQWKPVRSQTFTTNGFGAVDGAFRLDREAESGDYAVQLELNGSSLQYNFSVQASPLTYAISITPESTRYVRGETVRVRVDVRDSTGRPMTNTLLYLDQYHPGPDFRYSLGMRVNNTVWRGPTFASLSASTDATGRATFEFPAELVSEPKWREAEAFREDLIGLAVRVRRRTMTEEAFGFTLIRVTSAGVRLTANVSNPLQAAGQPFTLSASVTMVTGEPVANRTLAVAIQRYDRDTYDYHRAQPQGAFTSDANGQIQASLTLATAGHYQLTVTGYDTRGNLARGYATFDVVSPEAQGGTDLRLAADRDGYQPGEVAGLTIASPVSGPAWLTVERGTVRRTQLITLTAPLTRVALPIELEDAPNVFVSVNAWVKQDDTLAATPYQYNSLNGFALKSATVRLPVTVTGKTLTVTITPDKTRYAPGEPATFTVAVTNARGERVSAEVSLAVVDEVSAQWAAPLIGSPFAVLHRPRTLTVSGYDSFAPWRDLMRWGGGCGGCGGDWDDRGTVAPVMGYTTAGWAPTLRTDWKGEATVTFTLPNLHSQWRVVALAVTADTQVGEGSLAIGVR